MRKYVKVLESWGMYVNVCNLLMKAFSKSWIQIFFWGEGCVKASPSTAFCCQKDAGTQRLCKKKFASQFHQQNLSLICVLKFSKRCLQFAQFVQKKAFHSVHAEKPFAWVNFINVLRARFLYKIFGAKISNPKSAS
jgi:hypothetical protein